LDSLLEFWNAHSLLVLDILGTVIGLWYLWLEYRASISLWIVGIIMPAIYIFTYYKAGLYADFGLQVYYLLAALYGLFVWKTQTKHKNQEMPITHVPPRLFAYSLVCFFLLWVLIYIILIFFTDSNVPVCDSFINALSIVGLWMLARKFVEQWLVWLVVDLLSSVLYFYKDIPFTASLYGIYTVIAVFGYLKWHKLMSPDDII
jgi:nicotinamide mononucleotide transporter